MNCNLRRPHVRVLSVLICLFTVLETAFAGQSGVGVTIQVLEGNRAQNLVSQQASKPITLRILDRTGRALPNASVLFAPPEFGASGAFITPSLPVIVMTNDQGIAVAPAFRANASPGAYEIQIVATYMGEATRLLLPQSNVTEVTRKKSSKKMIIIGAVAGGAAVAAFAAKGKGGPGTPPPPVGATTAPPIVFLGASIGAPQ